jgi:hypothetical protein
MDVQYLEEELLPKAMKSAVKIPEKVLERMNALGMDEWLLKVLQHNQSLTDLPKLTGNEAAQDQSITRNHTKGV